MKKILMAMLVLTSSAFAETYTLTIHNYTNKTFHWHQDAGKSSCGGFMWGDCSYGAPVDIVSAPADVEFEKPSLTLVAIPDVTETYTYCMGQTPCNPTINTINHLPPMTDANYQLVFPGLTVSKDASAIKAPFTVISPEDLRTSLINTDFYIYPSMTEEAGSLGRLLQSTQKEVDAKLAVADTVIQQKVDAEVKNGNLVQTAIDNQLNATTAGNAQNNLAVAIGQHIDANRSAHLQEPNVEANNFYVSSVIIDNSGAIKVTPASSVITGANCQSSASPNYFVINADSNRDKNYTQLVASILNDTRVTITNPVKNGIPDCNTIAGVTLSK